MEVSTPPLFLFTNDAFATMLQFLPVLLLPVSVREIRSLTLCSSPDFVLLQSELAGSSLVGVWAHNVAIARRMAPVLVAKCAYTHHCSVCVAATAQAQGIHSQQTIRVPWSVSEVYRMSSLLRRRDGTTFRAVSHVQFFYDHSGMVRPRNHITLHT